MKNKKGRELVLDRYTRKLIRETIKKEMENVKGDLITSVKTELLLMNTFDEQLKLLNEEKEGASSKVTTFVSTAINTLFWVAFALGSITIIVMSIKILMGM